VRYNGIALVSVAVQGHGIASFRGTPKATDGDGLYRGTPKATGFGLMCSI
jgi:hypothetical protein